MILSIPVMIPDGDTCKHPNGEVCQLFHWGYEGYPFCRGWPEGTSFEHQIVDFKKHQDCLRHF